MKKIVKTITEEDLLKEFENSKKIAEANAITTADRYRNYAQFVKTHKCKIQGGNK